jgi:asparagine synthase (glutamine-hydrolysing)
MCRIAGIYNPSSENLNADILRMRDAMHRGGPDDAGAFVHPQLPLALGHRRLSLLDLSSAGHQPMTTINGRFKIVFNGEIYNFKEIRKKLETCGYQFLTQTDTEVILYSYQEWGKECFRLFNGMFALAIWDEQENEIILARDHAGIKPLYYFLSPDVFFFASEVRAFKAVYPKWEPDERWKGLFLLFGHLPEPMTTLKNVQVLGKGEWLSVHLPTLKKTSGVFYKDDYTPRIFSEDAALELVRGLLTQAVKRHLISDAPIGLFLSGGIDSSLLTLLSAPILRDSLQTLSIQFDEAEYSEESYQKIIIDITNAHHRAYRVNQQIFEEALDDIIVAMDQPSVDAINVYFISMYARQQGLKAVLSGLGADELFGGYPSFSRFKQWRTLRHVPKAVASKIGQIFDGKLAKLSYNQFSPMMSLYLMNRGLYTTEKASQLTGLSVREIEETARIINFPGDVDYSSVNANAIMESDLYMKNQLLKDADTMAMWHGLEIRVPFLDKLLVQAVNSISPDIKFKGGRPKGLLIEAFTTLLPAEIWCRKKQGFTFPFSHWLKKSELVKPVNGNEQEVFDDFSKGKLHWSRYWALKIAALEKFN